MRVLRNQFARMLVLPAIALLSAGEIFQKNTQSVSSISAFGLQRLRGDEGAVTTQPVARGDLEDQLDGADNGNGGDESTETESPGKSAGESCKELCTKCKTGTGKCMVSCADNAKHCSKHLSRANLDKYACCWNDLCQGHAEVKAYNYMCALPVLLFQAIRLILLPCTGLLMNNCAIKFCSNYKTVIEVSASKKLLKRIQNGFDNAALEFVDARTGSNYGELVGISGTISKYKEDIWTKDDVTDIREVTDGDLLRQWVGFVQNEAEPVSVWHTENGDPRATTIRVSALSKKDKEFFYSKKGRDEDQHLRKNVFKPREGHAEVEKSSPNDAFWKGDKILKISGYFSPHPSGSSASGSAEGEDADGADESKEGESGKASVKSTIEGEDAVKELFNAEEQHLMNVLKHATEIEVLRKDLTIWRPKGGVKEVRKWVEADEKNGDKISRVEFDSEHAKKVDDERRVKEWIEQIKKNHKNVKKVVKLTIRRRKTGYFYKRKFVDEVFKPDDPNSIDAVYHYKELELTKSGRIKEERREGWSKKRLGAESVRATEYMIQEREDMARKSALSRTRFGSKCKRSAECLENTACWRKMVPCCLKATCGLICAPQKKYCGPSCMSDCTDLQLKSSRPTLFRDDISFEDVNQGRIGNCWLIAALACMTTVPGGITNLFVTQQYNPSGRYIIRLFDPSAGKMEDTGKYGTRPRGMWRHFEVDDYIPMRRRERVDEQPQPLFVDPESAEMWPMLLEKAFAKMCGSYQALEGGHTIWALMAMTGGIGKLFERDRKDDLVVKEDAKGSLKKTLEKIVDGVERDYKPQSKVQLHSEGLLKYEVEDLQNAVFWDKATSTEGEEEEVFRFEKGKIKQKGRSDTRKRKPLTVEVSQEEEISEPEELAMIQKTINYQPGLFVELDKILSIKTESQKLTKDEDGDTLSIDDDDLEFVRNVDVSNFQANAVVAKTDFYGVTLTKNTVNIDGKQIESKKFLPGMKIGYVGCGSNVATPEDAVAKFKTLEKYNRVRTSRIKVVVDKDIAAWAKELKQQDFTDGNMRLLNYEGAGANFRKNGYHKHEEFKSWQYFKIESFIIDEKEVSATPDNVVQTMKDLKEDDIVVGYKERAETDKNGRVLYEHSVSKRDVEFGTGGEAMTRGAFNQNMAALEQLAVDGETEEAIEKELLNLKKLTVTIGRPKSCRIKSEPDHEKLKVLDIIKKVTIAGESEPTCVGNIANLRDVIQKKVTEGKTIESVTIQRQVFSRSHVFGAEQDEEHKKASERMKRHIVNPRGCSWRDARSGEMDYQMESDVMWKLLMRYYRQEAVLCCSGIDGAGREIEGKGSEGLLGGHAYSILGLYECPESHRRFIQVRNPWGSSEWRGDWSDNCSNWDAGGNEQLKALLHTDEEDGAFWMDWGDFSYQWGNIGVCERDVTIDTLRFRNRHEEDPCLGTSLQCFKDCFKFWCHCRGPCRLYNPVRATREVEEMGEYDKGDNWRVSEVPETSLSKEYLALPRPPFGSNGQCAPVCPFLDRV